MVEEGAQRSVGRTEVLGSPARAGPSPVHRSSSPRTSIRRLSRAAPGPCRNHRSRPIAVPITLRLRRQRRLRLRLLIPEDRVEQVLVQPRRIERIPPPPVRQRQQRGLADVGPRDVGPPVPRGVRDRRTRGDDVGAHPVDLEGGADLGDLEEHRVGELDLGEQLAGGGDPVGQRALGVGVRLDEGVGVGVEGEPAADDLGAQLRVARRGDLDGEAEAVEELGAELALLGVHGADEHEAGGVGDRDAVALDGGAAHRGGVEQQVDEVVVEEVDLVDVEDAAVGAGEQAGLVLRDAVGQDLGEVQRAEHAVLGGADGELDEAYGPGLGLGVERPRAPSGEVSPGALANRSPATTSMGGSTSARARTVVDFAVPFSPRTRTPPTSGEIVVRRRASVMSSLPTTAHRGYCCGMGAPALVANYWVGGRPVFGLPRSCLGHRSGPCAGFSPASQILPEWGTSRLVRVTIASAAMTSTGVPTEIVVVGIGADGWASLPASSQSLVLEASVLWGGSRHLSLVPAVPGQARVPWPSPLAPSLPGLLGRVRRPLGRRAGVGGSAGVGDRVDAARPRGSGAGGAGGVVGGAGAGSDGVVVRVVLRW